MSFCYGSNSYCTARNVAYRIELYVDRALATMRNTSALFETGCCLVQGKLLCVLGSPCSEFGLPLTVCALCLLPSPLCSRWYKFVQQRHSFQFIESNVSDSVFDSCTFIHNDGLSVYFTRSTFTNVVFKNSVFGTFDTIPKNITFEWTLMDSIRFKSCGFDKLASVLFKSFNMFNVWFEDCIFESDVIFEQGRIVNSSFNRCYFLNARSKLGRTNLFKNASLRNITIYCSEVMYPTMIESSNTRTLYFKDSILNELRYSGVGKHSSVQIENFFHDTTFTGIVNMSNITTWFLWLSNVTFEKDADFSLFTHNEMIWVGVTMLPFAPVKKTCNTLNLSRSVIYGQTPKNVKVSCRLDMLKTQFYLIEYSKVTAHELNLEEAWFNRKQFVGDECCTRLCAQHNCHCKYTSASTNTYQCPKSVPIDKKRSIFVEESPSLEEKASPIDLKRYRNESTSTNPSTNRRPAAETNCIPST